MILVTGARGLLGKEVVRQTIERGFSVRGTDLLPPDPALGDACEQLEGDLLDPSACLRMCQGVERIVHTAALQHHSRPPKFGRESFFQQNAAMTRNLADAAEVARVRHIVCVSSDMVYGIPRHGPFCETDTPHPIGPYGRSKLASEQACLQKRHHGIRVTILRPRLIVGAGRLGILTKLFDCIRAGKSIPLIGNGRNRYQMVGVSDVARAVLLALEKEPQAVFNLGSSDVPSVEALLKGVARRADSPSQPLRTPRRLVEAALWVLHAFRVAPLVPEQFRIAGVDYVLDTTAAREQLGWSPQFDDTEMLWQAYKWYIGGPESNVFSPDNS
ncbi:MAG: NAD(P)-dependent oxidoreductase [Phycisphaerae bacterium]|nr:NAD(P)-dependent oxidoreductase [Phycisphaerae bacterium]